MKCPENGESHANFGENNPESCFYSPRFGVVGHSHCVVGRLLSVRSSAPVTFGYSPLVVPSSVGGVEWACSPVGGKMHRHPQWAEHAWRPKEMKMKGS